MTKRLVLTYSWAEVVASGLPASRWKRVLRETKTADGRPSWTPGWVKLPPVKRPVA